jgi:subtilisin-like proprotein convertase family protein/uncharacterized protein YvpB
MLASTTAAAPRQDGPVFLPLVLANNAPPTQILACAPLAEPLPIPDADPAGQSSSLALADGGYLYDLEVAVSVTHPWVGDLTIDLVHDLTGRTVRLLQRPGTPARAAGCPAADLGVIFDDHLSAPAAAQCAASPAALAGIFTPLEPLAGFRGESLRGGWRLHLIDAAPQHTGALTQWCLAATVADLPPPAVPTIRYDVPPAASVSGVHAQHQALPLDCESRVAVDWAAFFGVTLDEARFFRRLPTADNPDLGFVGDVMGFWGQIPPHDYGVHAAPVAALLRDYGVSASAQRPLPYGALQTEIAAGRPVFVWTAGSGDRRSLPRYYRGSAGPLTIVAPYEHTVMVVAYTPQAVLIQDGGREHWVALADFLAAWSALGNMAITAIPYD